MSVAQSVDLSAVDQAKQQVRTVLEDLNRLAQRDCTPDEFHAEFLQRVVAALAAVAGIVWVFDSRTGLSLSYQINLQGIDFPKEEEGEKQHNRLLYKMLGSPDEGTLVPPHSGLGGEREAGNPTGLLLLCCPIRTELETVGLVEIFQRPDTAPAVQQGFRRFLAQVCRIATEYYKSRQLRHFGDRQSLWTLLEEFTRTIHRSLDVRETAFTVANEGRRLIDCDRVSVAVLRGSRCKIEAVSGQDMVDKRSATVRLLGNLAKAVIRSREPIWYVGDTSDFAPQVEKAIEEYVDQSHTKMLAVYPLARKPVVDSEEDETKHRRRKPEPPFAALIVEQIEDSRLTESLRRRGEIVAEHAAGALGNAIDHHSIFLMPLWKWIGKSKVLVTAQNLPKTVAVLALLVAIVLVLCFLPWKYEMHGTARLEPIWRHKIYAPYDAEVREIHVAHNSEVWGPANEEPGTLMLQLFSTELESTRVKLLGEAGEIDKQIESLDRRLSNEDKDLKSSDITQLEAQRVEARIRQETNRRQQEIYERQRNELDIRAPMHGWVVTWDIEKKLKSRPIGRMQFLLEIADREGPWELELAMAEKNMGPIITHLLERKKTDPNATLDVSFNLVNDPGVKYRGTVSEFQDRAEIRTDTGAASGGSNPGGINTVLIRVKLSDPDSLPYHLLVPGSECAAKVDCGTAPLGYVLLRGAITFVQKNILFRWF